MKKVSCFLAFSMAVAMGATAAEYFADAVNGNDANDGLTEATAKLSLKEAIALANTGDTVTLLPGDYSNGTVTVSSTFARAQITKAITLRSKNGRASRDVTRIVGKYDYETGNTDAVKAGGMGNNAVRGLWVTANGAGSTIEGITFVDCSAPFLTGSGDATSGGGIYFANGGSTSETADNLNIVDCAFIRCQATRGAGTYGGTTVRCLFKSCRHTKFGAGQRAGSAYNCVFDDCYVVPGLGQDTATSGGVLGYMRYIVNCTVVNCQPRAVSNSLGVPLGIYNCILQNNGDQNLPQYRVFNCVTDTSTMTSNGCAVSQIYNTAEVWSPMDDDYRINKGANACTKGSVDWLARIPEAYRDTDYYGNPRMTDGTVYCGAVQTITDKVGTGVAFRMLDEPGELELDGVPVTAGYRTWFQRTGHPFTIHLVFTPASPARGVLKYRVDTAYWALPDNSIDLIPTENHVKTLSIIMGDVVHVDPVNGDDANDGSAENPYRTLQKAADSTANADTLILAREGDYNEGGAEYLGSNRVYVTSSKSLRVKAVSGAANTFITGASDPAPVVANDYGLGPAAVRCIAAVTNANCCFQGFTLRDGRTDILEGNAASSLGHGAALKNSYDISSNFGAVLADCVITNCVGARAAVFGGALHRCRLTGCRTMTLGVVRSARVVASIFDRNDGGHIVGQETQAYHCTFVTNNCATYSASYGDVYNCVSGWRNGADVAGAPHEMKFSVFASKASGVSLDGSNTQENPVKFASPETGDWRLVSVSAGATLGYLGRLTGIGYAPASFDGTPFKISGGRVPAGALNVRAAATNYVDAVNGNDATADGTTEATAYRTLAAALAAAKPGDTVVALPGTYAEGTAVPTKAQAASSTVPTIAARAVVPSYVTLESRDGPETTVIEGVRATVDANSYGCGADAVRCVFLCQNATVRGFTLYNGHTDSGGSSYTDSVDTRGGGVGVANAGSVANGKTSLAESCIITNCTAARGAGGFGGTYRKCKFFDNNAPKPGTAIYWGTVEGCFFDNNPGHSIIYKSPVWNSTILATAKGNIAAINNEGTYTDTHQPIVNTILGTSSYVSSNLVNCAYAPSAHNRAAFGDAPNVNPAVGDLLIGTDGVPLAGSVAIDAGDMSQTPASLGDTDLAGGQRVYNGTMDIGCYEHDWRPKYAADLGKGVTVASASPEVYEGAGGVVTLPGGSLEAGWSNASGKKRGYSGAMRVTGTGTLTVTRNGETFKTVTSADGEQTFQFFSSAALEELAFAYAPGENDDGAALLSGFAIGNGFMVILR